MANHCLNNGWEFCCAICRAGNGGHGPHCWNFDNPPVPPTNLQAPTPPGQHAGSSTDGQAAGHPPADPPAGRADNLELAQVLATTAATALAAAQGNAWACGLD